MFGDKGKCCCNLFLIRRSEYFADVVKVGDW